MMFAIGAITMAVAFFISFLATPLAAQVAFRTGMLDMPQRHKAHAGPTPLLGGCAIFGAILGLSLLAAAIARIWATTGIPPWLPPSIAVHVRGAAAPHQCEAVC